MRNPLLLIASLVTALSCSPSNNALLADGGGEDPQATCACIPGDHDSLIYVVSSQSELFGYSPVTNEFTFLAVLDCPAGSRPFSMAVDQSGVAWILFSETQDVNTIDLSNPTSCTDPGYVPSQMQFALFGMSFSARSGDECPDLYAMSYSGSGPFTEGPGIGSLGVLNQATGRIEAIAPIDYDGGELAGTGDGRLFALAGVEPAKLIEYDKAGGAALATIPLDGFSKTNASAFAFFAGNVFLFTEAQPAGCGACLDQMCPQAHAACLADEVCADDLACAVEIADIRDECGGLLPPELQTCLTQPCSDACLVPPSSRVSEVTRLDLDASGPSGAELSVVNPEAPARIVGAGTSTCVPFVP